LSSDTPVPANRGEHRMTTTTEYFDRMAGHWTEKYQRDGFFRRRLETVLSWFDGEPAASSILDFGCGSGVLMGALLQCGRTVTGVDASPVMIETARAHLKSGAVRGRYTLELIDPEQFAGRYLTTVYAGVVCLGVLEYVPNASTLLARLGSVVAPGGVLILSAPNRSSLLRMIETTVYKHPGLFKRVPPFAHLTGVDTYRRFQTHQFTLSELSRVLASARFQLEEARYQVAPPPLQALDRHRLIGMTVLAKYRKAHLEIQMPPGNRNAASDGRDLTVCNNARR